MDTEETGSLLTEQTRYSLPMKLQHIVINFLTIHLTANSCTTGVLESVLREKAKQLEGDIEAVDPLRLISVTSADPTEFQFLLFIDSVFFPVAQQPLVGQGLLIVETSRSHSDTPHLVGLVWTGDQPDSETST